MRYNRKSVSVTASTDDPAISLADMKAFLRVDGSGDDDIITAYIATATYAVKEYLRRALLTETFALKADGFTDAYGDDRLLSLGPGVHTASRPYVLGGGDTLDLPFAPLQSVTSIVTYDRGNIGTTFNASRYGVDTESGRIYLSEGETWPSDLRAQDAVQVTYVAGYGSGSIPAPILEAIRMYVQSMYEGCAGMSDQAKALLAPYRRADELAW